MKENRLLIDFLDTESLSILEGIFKLTKETNTGVDAPSYRANHEDQLDILDKLERDGFLRKENEKYWVSLVGLSLLDDQKAKDLFSKFEKLFDVLRKYYKTNQRDQLKLTELADIVQMPVDEVRECLSYMIEGSWWGGRSSDFYGTQEAFIKPSESILKYKSFHDVIAQMQEWMSRRISGRINQEKSLAEGRGLFPNMFKNRIIETGEETARQKPDWYEKLDSEYQSLLDEVYQSLAMDMRALPAMGLRTVIDMVCGKLVGDRGTFAKKLGALHDKGDINKHEKEILEIAIDVGSASAHRGHTPKKEDLNTLLDIVEHLLQGIYVLRPASQKLKEATPKRKKTPKKGKK